MPNRDRISAIDIDAKSIVRWGVEVEHERSVAVFDLLERNSFRLVDGFAGPYDLRLSLRESVLVMEVSATGCASAAEAAEINLPVRPLRRVIKDYFLICDSYFQAIRGATPSRIEAIDMARRGLHDEGSQILREVLEGKVALDHDTARRLFTLICVLHIRG
ncbi:MAG TPA: UPF0262 family protein [Geminicoccaceae bacterium]|nr:UPF0262 family protein [Geminicoccus sp.]HMU53065.1 UPF0262 family protein [Geminicoccaceae bacterium]